MGAIENMEAEQTYRAIGRFMFEFSQVEYTVRHHLGEEIGLKDEYFAAVVESYDVGMLTTVAKEVFRKSRTAETFAQIDKLLHRFRELNDYRKRVAHGLWVPFTEGGTVHYVSRNKLTPARFTEQASELEMRADALCQLRADFENAIHTMPDVLERNIP
jgi:hypothetical protein